MTHQYIICEDCQILWSIDDYSQCPLCRLSKAFGHGMKGHWKDAKLEAETTPQQAMIQELTIKIRECQDNLLAEKEAHRQTAAWAKSNIEALERTRVMLDKNLGECEFRLDEANRLLGKEGER